MGSDVVMFNVAVMCMVRYVRFKESVVCLRVGIYYTGQIVSYKLHCSLKFVGLSSTL
jgi:hypothetical protein